MIRVARRQDLLWIIPVMVVTWVSLALAGVDFNIAFLLGISSAVIALVGFAYWEARDDARFWTTLALYSAVHVAVFMIVGGKWIPHPAVAITPVFLIDFMGMGVLFPKLSRIKFETE